MELRHLRSFTTIAETLNVSRAAAQLHVTQPALSRQLRDLEAEIGCTLFERVNHGVRLTPAGRAFLAGARRVLTASDALLAATRGTDGVPRPPLCIAHFGTLSAHYIGPFLHRMRRRYPAVNLQMDECVPGEALKRLRAGRLDAVFTGPPEPGRLRGFEWRAVWIAAQDIMLAANHALAKRRRVALHELRDERWGVLPDKDFPGFRRLTSEACRRAGFRPNIVAMVDSLASMLIYIAEGKLISHAPPLARTLPHKGVAFIATDPPGAITIPVLMVWRPDSLHRDALRWLAETMEASVPPAHRAGSSSTPTHERRANERRADPSPAPHHP